MRSSDVVDTAREAAELEQPPLVVREPLEAFLDAEGIGAGRIEVEPIGEGHSNVTFLVERGDARVVLRRPPRPPLPPSAHDVLREARLLERARGHRRCAIPRVLATCADESVLGVPFYVMEEMHGSVITSEIPEPLDNPAERRRVCEELVDRLVEVHAVDWRACGLEGYGKPTGYLERQLRRFGGLWEHNKTRELPVVEEVGRWLGGEPARVARLDGGARRLPARQRHGRRRGAGADRRDLRLGAVDDRRPARRRRLPDASPGRRRATRRTRSFGRLSAATRREGFMTRDELIARYEERSGRSMAARQLVPGAGALEGRRVHGGQLQALLDGQHGRRRTSRPSTSGVPMLAEKAREIAL